jgi:transposase
MDHAALASIDDIEVLRTLLREQMTINASHEQRMARDAKAMSEKDAYIAKLKAENVRLRRLQFAARSEKLSAEQRDLFSETLTEEIAAIEAELARFEAPADSKEKAPRQKNTRTRRTLPDHLPRVEKRHEPSNCCCDSCGADRVHVRDHISEKLACKPLEFYVRRDIYPQYACRKCETIVSEPVAPTIIDRGMAAPSLLAHVVIAKYIDHLPLYRQEAIYLRSGIELSRAMLAEWMGACGVALQPLADRLRERMKSIPILHADETPVGLLDPGSGRMHRSYLFVYRTAIGPPIVLFDFCTSRSGEHARRFLGDWRGTLMVDDYGGYKALFRGGITELGCWVHVRRKFFEQYKASGSTLAMEALARIAMLYRVEDEASQMDASARQVYRQHHALPVLQAFKTWLVQQRKTIVGNSKTAKAVDHALKRWDALTRYVEDGRYPIDNNPVENAIRPIALGRKNWLFVGAERAGHRAAAIMGLLATAKANGLNPHAWLSDVLARLPTTLDRDIDTLLPLDGYWQPAPVL